MKSAKYIVTMFLASFFFLGTNAQQGTKKFEINYTVGVPTGNLKNVINQTSWRGGEGALMFGLTDQLSLGLQAGYQDFYQKFPREIISEAGSDISAVITNSIQVIPVMIKAKYNLASTASIQPFISLAAGANLVTYQKFYGEFVDDKNSLGFAAQPSAGIHIPIGSAKQSGFHLAAGYNYMPFKYNDADGLSHATIKAGFTINLND